MNLHGDRILVALAAASGAARSRSLARSLALNCVRILTSDGRSAGRRLKGERARLAGEAWRPPPASQLTSPPFGRTARILCLRLVRAPHCRPTLFRAQPWPRATENKAAARGSCLRGSQSFLAAFWPNDDDGACEESSRLNNKVGSQRARIVLCSAAASRHFCCRRFQLSFGETLLAKRRRRLAGGQTGG